MPTKKKTTRKSKPVDSSKFKEMKSIRHSTAQEVKDYGKDLHVDATNTTVEEALKNVDPTATPCKCGAPQRVDLQQVGNMPQNAVLTCSKCGVKKMVVFKTDTPSNEITEARW